MDEELLPPSVGVFVKDGKFAGMISPSESLVYENADIIHEAMIILKRENCFKEGAWLWGFSTDFQEVWGFEL